MDSPASVAIAAVLVVLVVWLWRQGRPAAFPPGPPCLPVLGSLPFVSIRPIYLQLNAWRKKYGDIFSFSFGSHHIIVLSGYDVVKDALVQHSVQFAGRTGVEAVRFRWYTPNYPILGIVQSTHSKEWRNQRSISLQILRSLGYGKSNLEVQIRAEASALRDTLAATRGWPTNPTNLLGISVSNVMCSLLYSERYDHNNQEFKTLIQIVEDFFKYLKQDIECDYIWLLSFKPSYKKVLQNLETVCCAFNKFNEEKIKERRERLEKDGYSEPRDFIEHYLCELHKVHGSNKLTEDWLPGIVNDFYLAGTDTSSTTLSWACLWMAARLDIQDKVYEEVSKAMEGSNGDVTLSLRDQCPYLEATLMEVMRMCPVAPLAITHTTTADVTFHGYNIPQHVKIFINLYSVLMDPEVWPEPDQFRPERHLDEGNVIRKENWIPFSMGRHSCLGEQLARQELFIFFATILSSFMIRLPEGHQANFEPSGEGLIPKPYPYELIFEPRNQD